MNIDGATSGLARTTSDGTRTYTSGTSNGAYSTTVQDENENQTLRTFGTTAGLYYETHRTTYQGAVGGIHLQETLTCYNGASGNCDAQAVSIPISEVDTTSSFNSGTQAVSKNTYDALGNLVNAAAYSGPSLIEQTALSYNGNSEVLTSTTVDGSGNTVAASTFGYDESTPVATSGVPQHVAVSGGIRGNQTSSHVSTGSGTLTTTMAYYDTGAVQSMTAQDGGQITYGYDPTQAFATSTNFPTPPSGVALSTSASYDTASGAILSTTGLNAGQTSTVNQYDALLRPTSLVLPSGSQISYTYTYNSPNQDLVTQSIGNGVNAYAAHLVDGYGRLSQVAVYNGQSSNPWYQVDSCYGVGGLLQFQSAAYQANGFGAAKHCSGPGTSYQYDALGRVTSASNNDGVSQTAYQGRAVQTTDVNGIQRISQYDLLGRLAGVCEISSAAMGNDTPSPCGMDIAGSGYVTSYSYNLASHTTTITQGAQHRVFQTDAAGRSISVSEPERGQTNYSYAYNSTGQVVTRTKPRANQTSPTVVTHTITQYDHLGRVVSTTYDDNLTYPKQYYYDIPLPGWGISGANMIGQLTGITDTARTAASYG